MAGGLRMTGKGGVIDKTRMVDDIYKSCCCIARVLYINTVLSSGRGRNSKKPLTLCHLAWD